ncbi:hypothetical protein NQ315_014322 [Exocentrus adspersus]|uniref:Uncharacterized protein n=1 Tax=Exocentrus adspersus TaxID=1586481 RepID=A0AAV8VM71_9CUCU|nr:hypothetical protein NQ315_014322 [Exocentrus adspersus]
MQECADVLVCTPYGLIHLEAITSGADLSSVMDSGTSGSTNLQKYLAQDELLVGTEEQFFAT